MLMNDAKGGTHNQSIEFKCLNYVAGLAWCLGRTWAAYIDGRDRTNWAEISVGMIYYWTKKGNMPMYQSVCTYNTFGVVPCVPLHN